MAGQRRRQDTMIEHIQGQTAHARRGSVRNAFRYGVDYVLCDPEARERVPLLSWNRFNLWWLSDSRHGGPRGSGDGAAWFRGLLAERGFPEDGSTGIRLLAQPSFLWFHFSPVSFWFALRDGAPCAMVAEVNNTFGHRHCYFCAHEDFRPILPGDTLTAEKLMHVSPFQEVAGEYRFTLSLTETDVRIRIAYENGSEGVIATLAGARRKATARSLLGAALRRPLGAARVLALIHWQAAILALKRAPFRNVPPPPEALVSDGAEFRRRSG